MRVVDLDGRSGPRPPETTPLPPQEASDGIQITQPTGVEITGLNAVAEDGGVLLTWETASENDIVGFNVLRSTDGGEFVAVNAELIVAQYVGRPVARPTASLTMARAAPPMCWKCCGSTAPPCL